MKNSLFLFVLFFSISGCISKGKNYLDVIKDGSSCYIYINESTNGIEFNWHGGGWQHGMNHFKLTIPLDKNMITGKEMLLKNHHQEVIDINESSMVNINGCVISIELYKKSNVPFEFNGIYNVPRWSCSIKT